MQIIDDSLAILCLSKGLCPSRQQALNCILLPHALLPGHTLLGYMLVNNVSLLLTRWIVALHDEPVRVFSEDAEQMTQQALRKHGLAVAL